MLHDGKINIGVSCVTGFAVGQRCCQAMHCQLVLMQARAISSGKAGHVKACCIMRGALELLDFEDASIMDMKRMLLQVRVNVVLVSTS